MKSAMLARAHTHLTLHIGRNRWQGVVQRGDGRMRDVDAAEVRPAAARPTNTESLIPDTIAVRMAFELAAMTDGLTCLPLSATPC